MTKAALNCKTIVQAMQGVGGPSDTINRIPFSHTSIFFDALVRSLWNYFLVHLTAMSILPPKATRFL